MRSKLTSSNRFLTVATLTFILVPGSARSQVLSQSQLTLADADPSFKLTIDQLAENQRWLGVPPRDIRWSPDGESIYFRWREDPQPDQLADSDPWYAADPSGRRVRQVRQEEITLIPSSNLRWSSDRAVAAWSREGNLFVWDKRNGSRLVFSTDSRLGEVEVSANGSFVYFATSGLSRQVGAQGDLWVYDLESRLARQLAEVVTPEEELSEAEDWLRDQQLELIEIVRKREQDQAVEDSIQRARYRDRPQSIPVEEGARAYDLKRSPDGRFITFLWIEDTWRKHRTSFIEFVNDEGYATEEKARPKVGEPLPKYKMGIVAVDPVVDPDSVEVTWVEAGTDKETVVHGPFWSPTGTHAVVQILSMDHKDRWISLLDLETGETTVIDHQHEDAWIGGPLVGGRWSPGYLQWLPDGSAFGFVSTASGSAMLYLAELDGSITQLTDGEWEVRRASLSPDGKTWYLETSMEHPGEEHLYHLPARGGQLERITQGEGMYRVFPSPDGRRLAVSYETERLMRDLYVLSNRPGQQMRRVTKSGTDDFYRLVLAESEIVTFSDPAGLPTWGQIWEAPEVMNGAAVVYVHGCGECAQGVTKGWRRVRAKLYANYLRDRGYVVANFDYRGSSGYGHANRTYAYRQMGVSDVDSSLPFLDMLVERYGVDPKRIGVYGGSYGGFFTLMAMFRHPDRYAAGVALYPVTDWAHYNQGYTSRILNGTPQSDEEAYRVSSPVYYAEGLRGALMIQHGLVDDNVQIQDSFRLAQMLIELEKDFELVVYPMEDHGWDEVPTRKDSYKRMTRWFERNLVTEVTAASLEEEESGSR
ncbi:MAG: prolyl oligopeptidase family serine peptidase [Gemmatimonadota bacterium]